MAHGTEHLGDKKSTANASQTKPKMRKEEKGISAVHSLGSFVCLIPCYKLEGNDLDILYNDPDLALHVPALSVRISVTADTAEEREDEQFSWFFSVLNRDACF